MESKWKRGKFTYTREVDAIQFDPNKHPWHRSIQRQTIDGKIPDDFEAYWCIIPMEGIERIEPGDWIIVDMMDNAKGVISLKGNPVLWIQKE